MTAVARVVSLLAALGAAPAAGAPPGSGALPADGIESCVGSEAIRFAPGALRVALAAADRERVDAALRRRFPPLAALPASQIALWRRPAGDWVYVTLLADPLQPARLCFTATAAAASLGFSGELLRRYFPELH